MLKGLTDEVGSRQLYMSSLYEYLPLFEADPEGRRAATEVALCELMQSGVTTVCDLSAAREDWLDTLGASGMRVYAAPMFRSGGWYTPNGHEVRYTWDEQAGREGLDRALRVIDRARQHPPGRLDGVPSPSWRRAMRIPGATCGKPRAKTSCARSTPPERRSPSLSPVFHRCSAPVTVPALWSAGYGLRDAPDSLFTRCRGRRPPASRTNHIAFTEFTVLYPASLGSLAISTK